MIFTLSSNLQRSRYSGFIRNKPRKQCLALEPTRYVPLQYI